LKQLLLKLLLHAPLFGRDTSVPATHRLGRTLVALPSQTSPESLWRIFSHHTHNAGIHLITAMPQVNALMKLTLEALTQESVPAAGGRTNSTKGLAQNSSVSHLQRCNNSSLASVGKCESGHYAAGVKASLQSTRSTYGVQRNRVFSVKLGGILFLQRLFQ